MLPLQTLLRSGLGSVFGSRNEKPTNIAWSLYLRDRTCKAPSAARPVIAEDIEAVRRAIPQTREPASRYGLLLRAPCRPSAARSSDVLADILTAPAFDPDEITPRRTSSSRDRRGEDTPDDLVFRISACDRLCRTSKPVGRSNPGHSGDSAPRSTASGSMVFLRAYRAPNNGDAAAGGFDHRIVGSRRPSANFGLTWSARAPRAGEVLSAAWRVDPRDHRAGP